MDLHTRVLLVDDEAALLRLMQQYLGKLGYGVEAYADGKSALNAFEASPGSFELLVADVTLPDIPGNELAVRMASRNPALRVVLCSGYPFDVESLPAELRHRVTSLQKPFLPNALAKTVEQILASRDNQG